MAEFRHSHGVDSIFYGEERVTHAYFHAKAVSLPPAGLEARPMSMLNDVEEH
jgi:hypothetical protein